MLIKWDKQSSIKLENNTVFQDIDIHHHFVIEKIQSKEINMMYCNTNEDVENMYTNPLLKIHFPIKGGNQNNVEMSRCR